jgi:predicted ATPase/DNA-binding winged helix-turn-helix (wHTH) protein
MSARLCYTKSPRQWRRNLTQGLDNQASGTICFGPFEVDVKRRLLMRASRPIPLGSRAMDILIAFLARPNQLITTRELLACAWPRTTAVQANLRAQIAVLRRVLGEGEKGRRFIQNVPGRGYRFIYALESQTRDVPGESPASSQHWQAPSGTRILGRDDLLADILARLPHRRLLTLVGPGGIGKTTVALAIANAFGPTRVDGVRWVDLSGLTREDSAAEAIAVAIGLVNFTGDHSPAVISWLRDKRLLLVLDCCDRVVDSVAVLAEMILSATTEVHILATSRETLRAAGEHVIRLPPLSLPFGAGGLPAEQAMSYPAIQLFAERAASVLGGFILRDDDVPHVARICARLDGIALAIELAAGHLVAIELRSLAALLEDKFRLLPIGRRTALARHRTMNAVLEWSFDTLSMSERELLLGVAIFEGEFELAAVRAVISGGELSKQDSAEAISRLVDKSLVATRITAAGLTYHLLDTTRDFALGRLREAGRIHEISRRHAVFLLDTLRRIETESHGLGAADWSEVRRRELANMRAALNWVYESDAADSLKLALSAVAARILLDLSLVEQCRRRATQALLWMAQHQAHDLALEMRLRKVLALASYYTPGPVAETVEMLERAFAISESLNDVEFRAIALWGLWSVSIFRNEPEKALSFAQRFRGTRADLSDDARDLIADRMTGIALHFLGDQAGARDCLERVSARFDPMLHSWNNLGSHVDHGLMARVYLARVLWLRGEPARGLRMCEDSVEALRVRGHAIARCHGLFEIAIPLDYMSGNFEAANANLFLLQDLAAEHGLAIFQAGAVWTALAFSAIREKTDLGACRAAARALRECRYDAQYPWLSGILAEEALRRGDVADGLEWISPCLAQDNGASSGWWSAELQRLRGELVAAGAAPAMRAVALAVLQQSIDTARRQGAVALELRSTISLVRVDRGYRARADLKLELDVVLGKFPEGSETLDLIAARRLSAELAA